MIYYLTPEYIDTKGDCCRVKRSDGEMIYKKRVKSVIKGLYFEKCMDMKAVRDNSTRLLNQKSLIPLYLGGEEILVPFKARVSRIARDPGYGYFNVFGYERITDKSIVLKDGTEILFLDSRRSIVRRINMALRLRVELRLPLNSGKNEGSLEAAAALDVAQFLLKELVRTRRRDNKRD
jgi:hypothetical protein